MDGKRHGRSFLIGYCCEEDQSKGTSVEKSITGAFTQTKQDTVKVLEELVPGRSKENAAG